MLPEIAEYQRRQAVADEEYTEKIEELLRLRRERQIDHSDYHEEVCKVDLRRRTLYADTWTDLRKSSDPLVRWIAYNVPPSYRIEAEEILEFYDGPDKTTLEDLDELADRKGWCSVWNDLRNRAIADGVLEDNRKPQIVARVNNGTWAPAQPALVKGLTMELLEQALTHVRYVQVSTEFGTVIRYQHRRTTN